MGRWLKPDVYPLIGAMSLVTGMCVFQLTRNVFLNPDVRVSKSNRQSAVPENEEEGERYSQHAFRRFVSAHRPEGFPAPHFRVSKSNRQSAVPENEEEGERYSQHAFRRFVSAHRREVSPAINRFFSGFSAK
ncbi:hypothetical protein TRIUR3_24112 [Triticum urartu]|uniref:NADH-ubiquinone reductase complex 1 MLRQ subunit n=1 Tax=Triticum urartu TaxID=4572 RepID=M7Z1J0_TRIUA|nr:hypothetical protein TRIUR3_24112 [Triticum urartu]